LLFTITRGQAIKFELKGRLIQIPEFELDEAEWEEFYMGKQFNLQTSSPSIKGLLKQMDGKKVRIIIQVEEGK